MQKAMIASNTQKDASPSVDAGPWPRLLDLLVKILGESDQSLREFIEAR